MDNNKELNRGWGDLVVYTLDVKVFCKSFYWLVYFDKQINQVISHKTVNDINKMSTA